MIQDKAISLVIIGAKGCGRDFLWTIRDCNKVSKQYEVLGFIDDDESLKNKIIDNIPVLGGMEWFSTNDIENISCVVAVADGDLRQKIVGKLTKKRINFPTIIHPSVIMSGFKDIGIGVIVQAGSIFAANTTIGNHVQVNLDCTIGHNTILDDFVTITTGVHIGGDNKIGTGTFIGSGAVTKEKLNIGKWCKIGAGTVLIDDVSDYSMYVGVPGKLKKKLKSS